MSARGAVRLSGVAPCFVPNHGHAASILHATAALIADPGLRAALANTGCAWVARCGGLLLEPDKPYGNSEKGYSNWELSADRANASRRELVSAGMPDAKLGRVVGLAASDLLDPKNPRSPSNRRITITVLTREAEERLMGKGIPEIASTELLTEKQENPPPSR